MKIALFTDSYTPNTDGVVSSILAYKSGMEKLGHEYFIFSPDADGMKPEKNEFRFHSVKFPPYPQYRAALFPHVSGEVARKTGVELVHSKAMVNMGLAAISFAKRCRLPSMASLETMIPDGVHYVIKHRGAQQFGKRLAWGYLRWFYSNFDLVTAPSRHAQGLMKQNGIESEVLPSPINTDFFKPNAKGRESMRKALKLQKQKLVISVGRVVKEKNYSFFIKVAKVMREPDVKFVIAGRGPYLEELQKEIAASGVADRFVIEGFLPREKLVDFYNAGDVFLFASPFETQGLVQLEAMACGTPACIMKDTAPAECIRNGKNGRVFSEDAHDCAEKLLDCIEKRKKFSPEARKTALEYSVPVLSKRLEEKYKRLLG
ncbi:MAG: glycosyltransferase [Candidatus Anstonellaceae archaeon]